MKLKIRLDQLLFEKKLCQSRSRARDLIMRGLVSINQTIQTKPATLLDPETPITILEKEKYVSRGAEKIKHALEKFAINPHDLIVADFGASTGGFTDYLIQKGASKVYAVDIGKDQLASKLRQNPKVTSFESTDVRTLKELPEKVDLIVADLSYISLTQVLPHFLRFLKPHAPIVALLKPQFEAGPQLVPKDGIIKNPETLKKVLNDFRDWCDKNNFQITKTIPSPITGKSGNKEYLALIFPNH